MELVRIYEIPDCKMVSSGIGMFGEEKFERFNNWFSSL
jgi:AraC family transcriptional regulator